MAVIDIEAFKQASATDPEFTRAMRYYDGIITLRVAQDESHDLVFRNGKFVDGGTTAEGPGRIAVGGTAEQWGHLLEAYPKPFYQCLQSSTVKHGMTMTDTNETFAYLPALNRMVQIMRALRQKGG